MTVLLIVDSSASRDGGGLLLYELFYNYLRLSPQNERSFRVLSLYRDEKSELEKAEFSLSTSQFRKQYKAIIEPYERIIVICSGFRGYRIKTDKKFQKIFWVHNLLPWIHIGKKFDFYTRLKFFVMRFYLNSNIRGSAFVVHTSHWSQQILEKKFPGCTHVVVRNPVSDFWFDRLPLAPAPRYPETANIVVTGTFLHHKCHVEILAYLNKLSSLGFPMKVIAVGGAPSASFLKKLKSISSRFYFLDIDFRVGLKPDELKIIYLRSDLVIVPSRVEAGSITLAEVLALRRRLICSDIPSFREVVNQDFLFSNDSFSSFKKTFFHALEADVSYKAESQPRVSQAFGLFLKSVGLKL